MLQGKISLQNDSIFSLFCKACSGLTPTSQLALLKIRDVQKFLIVQVTPYGKKWTHSAINNLDVFIHEPYLCDLQQCKHRENWIWFSKI